MATGAQEPVVEILAEEWTALSHLGRELTEMEWAMPSECPGWTVRDLLSHVVGTEHGLLGDPEPEPIGELPDHVHNDVGARNESWVAPRRALPAGAVLAEFDEVTTRRLRDLRSWSTARFEDLVPSPVGTVPYREFMRVRVMDCWVHEQDMRVATARAGHDTGPAAVLSVERLVSAMPFVVGKRAGASEGESVRFELRGGLARQVDVAVVNGRGSVVELSVAPTCVLDMSVETFRRLACGRVSGPAARAASLVELRGDAGLGSRVLDVMAFMI